MARFKELTTGHAVVMGRKTWESLPDRFRPLPDRRNIVVTRDPRVDGGGGGAGRLDPGGGARASRRRGARVRHRWRRDLRRSPPLRRRVRDHRGRPRRRRRHASSRSGSAERSMESPARSTSPTTARAFALLQYRSEGDVDARLASSPRSGASTRSARPRAGIAYWLFGGWAVDFHAGRITRLHDDVDIAVWLEDVPRIVELLTGRRLDPCARAG